MTAQLEIQVLRNEMLKEYWKHALPYNLYRGLIDALVVYDRTTGCEQADEKIKATKLNVHRMNRVEKTFVMNEHLKEVLDQLPCTLNWLLITEGWCGDCAQIVPALKKIADESNGKIMMKTILRDENPDLMNTFLTNGNRGVPKLICMDESFHVLSTWGPRPEYARKLVIDLKSSPATAPFFKEELHKWYAKDRSQTVEEEIARMLLLVSSMQKSKN